MLKYWPGIIFLLLTAVSTLNAVETISNAQVLEGLEHLRTGEYEQAATLFAGVLEDSRLEDFHGDAAYWLMKSLIALGDHSEAAAAAYLYIDKYPNHGRLEEASYQAARLLLLEGDAANAILALKVFMDSYPGSELVPSAMYWIGESLMFLGRVEEADIVFAELLSSYPASVKREAARFRRSEISFLYREKELLSLLKWSHEEYLRDAEDFYRRESEYKSALTAYESDESGMSRERLLDLKARLLVLQRYYTEKLLEVRDAY